MEKVEEALRIITSVNLLYVSSDMEMDITESDCDRITNNMSLDELVELSYALKGYMYFAGKVIEDKRCDDRMISEGMWDDALSDTDDDIRRQYYRYCSIKELIEGK